MKTINTLVLSAAVVALGFAAMPVAHAADASVAANTQTDVNAGSATPTKATTTHHAHKKGAKKSSHTHHKKAAAPAADTAAAPAAAPAPATTPAQ